MSGELKVWSEIVYPEADEHALGEGMLIRYLLTDAEARRLVECGFVSETFERVLNMQQQRDLALAEIELESYRADGGAVH